MPDSILKFHDWLTRDPLAMGLYQSAIAASVRPGDVVLDVGAGSGILSYMACAAGASMVHAIEPAEIANVIPRIATENHMAGRISVHRAKAKDVALTTRANGAILSMFDSFGLDNNMVSIAVDTRKRLLGRGGWLIPSNLKLSMAPVDVPGWYQENIDCWEEPRAGFSLDALRRIASNQKGGMHLEADNLLAPAADFPAVDLRLVKTPDMILPASFNVTRTGMCHAIGGWFHATLAAGVAFGNSPFDENRLPWSNIVFPLESPVPVQIDSTIRVVLRCVDVSGELLWLWDVKVFSASGKEVSHQSQSTFSGLMLDPGDLALRASSTAER